MSRAVEVLRGDHKTFLQLLDLIEREIELFGRAEQPDYALLEAILEYFKAYPWYAHHPAENLVYDMLMVRAPEMCGGIPDPCCEHEDEEKRLNALMHLVQVVLREGEIPRDTVMGAARSFVEHMRRHLEMEEARLLPAALENLHTQDWAEIDARFGERLQGALNSSATAHLDDLRVDILRWCAERGERARQEA